MNTTITLNVKTRVNLRQVAFIERVTSADIDRLAKSTGQPRDRLDAFKSNVRFLDGSNRLVTQSFEEISRRAAHRFIAVRAEAGEGGKMQVTQIVPIDAVRHFEPVSAEDRQAMKARYPDTDPARIDALKTRFVYLEYDPVSLETDRPNFFQKMFGVDVNDDLAGRQKLAITNIGHDRFVLSDEIEAVRDLTEAELQNLARKYNLRSDKDGDLTTSITLRSGDLIMSSYPADEIMGEPKDPKPQAATPRKRSAVRAAAMS